MKKTYLILIALVLSITSLNAQWYELVTPTIDYDIKYNSFIDLEINAEGDPYLLYNCKVPTGEENDTDGKLFVQKFNSETEEWSMLGDNPINDLSASENRIAMDSDGNVYVAFMKVGGPGSGWWCTVLKFDGTEWIQIGGDWNTSVIESDVTMYCDNQDDVYVSYYDVDTYSGPVVKKYLGTGTEWETIGDVSFHPSGQCLLPAITSDDNGNVFVSYGGDDFLGGLPLSVKKFDGTSWDFVGTNGFYDEPNYPTSIIVGKDDVIHTTTTDFWSLWSTVLDYQNNSWDDHLVGINGGYMPFTKHQDDVYMGYTINDNGYKVKVKKIDKDGNWVDLPDQPGPYFTTPVIPKTFFDLEADSYGNLYIAMLKGDQWNHHVAVLKLDITTGINEPQNENHTIYPNPTNGIINIKTLPGGQIHQVLVYDISGKIVSQTDNPGSTIDLSGLGNGIYFVKVNTAENSYIEKVIVR